MTAKQKINTTIKSIVALSLLLIASCSKSDDPAAEYPESPHGKVSIAHLKTLAIKDSKVITEDISIEGYVVANDLFGEYYKSIVVCDESGGIEISVDTHSTAKTFPIAAKVTIHCTSLTLGNFAGRIILGAKANDDYTVGRIAESDFARHFAIDLLAAQAIEPTKITISEISPNIIGNYIEINDVAFTNSNGIKWCDTDPATGEFLTSERELSDSDGNTISVRTIAQCIYASEILPSGIGKVRGIVEKYNSRYSLRIVNRQFDFNE
ncbi:MAG: hypothetical protein IJB87_05895 [Alistipes sp.]|nr:hypothetical protein [Alistipes sp.]